MGKKYQTRKTYNDSVKEMEEYFYKNIDNEFFDKKEIVNKYKEYCLEYILDNFSQIPASLFFVFETIARGRIEDWEDF